jgi:hypothetical protein
LAVDRAVIRSDERTLERSYLAGLASDMQATVAAATAAVADAETRDLAARSVLRAARADVPPGTAGLDVARALVRAGFVGDVSFVRETWDDIVGTGRLQLLRDDDLRRRLGSFYRLTDQLRGFGADWVDQASAYQLVVNRILEPEVTEAVYLELIYRTGASEAVSPDIRELVGNLRTDPDLLPRLSPLLVINPVAAQSYESLAEQARELERAIQEALQAS